ncbi:DNA polymerase III subunit beta [Paenibacillus tepidiphilus]|uniref:DNA polymerase III subunit beta n=1 Tax=Paenibacillus tepidiphilus TaxID=2608683 RepID=UPI0012391E6E|nr:DNA polymerase III subunit beta [Paenibacillus tepidiphilus]
MTKIHEGEVQIEVKDREKFTSMLSNIAMICSDSTNVILSGIKIETKKGNVLMTGGDGIVFTCVAGKDVVYSETNTEFVISAKLISDVFKKLPKREVIFLFVSEKMLRIKAGKPNFELTLMDHSEYPVINIQEKSVSKFEIAAHEFVGALKSTVSSASNDDTLLSGVNVEMLPIENSLRFSATDRHRLFCSYIRDVKASPFRETLSVVTCREIIRCFEKVGNDVSLKVTISKSLISVMGPGILLTSKIKEGEFPPVEQLIPRTFITETISDREALYAALMRSSVLIQSKKVATFIVKDGEMTVVGKTDIGQTKESVICDSDGQVNMQIVLDVFFMIDVLKAFNSDKLMLSFSGPQSPVKITEPTQENSKVAVVNAVRQ